MGYGRLGQPGATESFCSIDDSAPEDTVIQSPSDRRPRRLLLLGVTAALLLLVSAVAMATLFATRRHASGSTTTLPRPTQAISDTCRRTLYPSLCITSLLEFPGGPSATSRLELVPVSVNMTTHHVSRAASAASALAAVAMDLRLRSMYDSCMELLSDSLYHLSRSLAGVTPTGDVGDRPTPDDLLTWLSAALTSHDTCADALDGADGGYVKDEMVVHLKDLAELISNSLAIVSSAATDGILAGHGGRRRRLMGVDTLSRASRDGFPSWVGRTERRLLEAPAYKVHADFVVSKDGGNGTYRKISHAVKAAPKKSKRRIVIYVKTGRYEENVKVGRKKTNLMLIGDGRGKTVVVGHRSVRDHYTTFHTATFAATGAGFIARDMSFQNRAGPKRHQAVALRVGADHSVVYRCSIVGYQDTLYAHSLRQFYRECGVYGTVDFVFGNAAVVLQNCSLYAREPLRGQSNTVTAQGRKDPNQNTGISIHNSLVLPSRDLARSSARTFLGRPWKMYSRTVYMESYIAGHVDPTGWLEWDGDYGLETLYYGEYRNYGPGAGLGKRVGWAGYRVITLEEEASKFTVGRFIGGTSWLPSTGVAFLAGLAGA